MNKRILILAASHFPRDSEGNISATPEMIMEFAELLIRECAQLVQGVPTDTMGYHTADQKIKQHFGVE